MLSQTYTLNALKVEQERVRAKLHAFRKSLDKDVVGNINKSTLEQMLHQIKLVHLNSRWRRLEVHVLPEISDASECMALLLAELDSIRLLGLELYRTVRDQLRMAIDGKPVDMNGLLRAMRLYCSTLQELLAKEERQLFNEAFAHIEEDRWFPIAQRFMQIDGEMLKCGEMGEIKRNHCPELAHLSSIGHKTGTEFARVHSSQQETFTPAVHNEGAESRKLPRLAS